jgi:hypothetical protein
MHAYWAGTGEMMMVSARGLARLSILAVGLGIGAALAAMPGSASADSTTDLLTSIDGLLGGAAVPAADPFSGLNLAISMDGATLFQVGTAAAYSGADGDIAIANGPGAAAYAYGTNDYAAVDGTNSTAWSGGFNPAGAVGSKDDTAFIFGDNDTAFAGGSDGHPGTFDYAVIFGNGNEAVSGGNAVGAGSYDGVYIEGNDLGLGHAQGGNYLADILKFYGDGSTTTSAAAADSSHLLTELLPSTGTAADSSNVLAELVSLFDSGAAAADSGHLVTDLASLF